MGAVILPNDERREVSQGMDVVAMAKQIGSRLAKDAIAAKIDGSLVDLTHELDPTTDVSLEIVTASDPEGLEVIRHSCAHLLAQAVKRLFPTAQVTIGPVIDNGFYYDFAFGRAFTPEDLKKIEKTMQKIVSEAIPVTRMTKTREEAIALFEGMGEHYKAEIIRDIPEGEILSLYQQGDFVDLCRGPHVPNTNRIKAFKLTKLAGAYWRGDSNNEMLQRIYGTAWPTKADLKDYLHRLEEAEKRDHRKLGKQLDLFHLQDVSPGMVFWHHKGWQVYRLMEEQIRELLAKHEYQEVKTPQMADRRLWEASGHWEKFGNEMFTTETENSVYAVKPMNCPCHVQIYNQQLTSYRDLPIRMAEFGSCHRREPSGTLHGLMRLRHFVQDDAHIFCTEEQIGSEVDKLLDLVAELYGAYGFTDVEFKLSTRPENRVGSEEVWDKAEKALEDALNAKGLSWTLSPGEGAFYGPKIECSLRDCLERVWQCGTIQIDFSMPERLGATYIDPEGHKRTPVMIHRALFGSIERFLAIVVEHYAGKLPIWLSPVQMAILTISDKHNDYARTVYEIFNSKGIRAHLDLRNEKIGYKIRQHTIQKVPFQLVIGDKEVEEETVAVRTCNGEDMGSMDVNELFNHMNQLIEQKK